MRVQLPPPLTFEECISIKWRYRVYIWYKFPGVTVRECSFYSEEAFLAYIGMMYLSSDGDIVKIDHEMIGWGDLC